MIKKILKFSLLIILLVAAIFSWQILIPRIYNVPHAGPRAGTQFWDLPTGSHIAYTLVPAKGDKKPFPIIFLQGGPGGRISDQNIEILGNLAENGYDVYLYDQIGSGYSDRLKNIEAYTADRHKHDLEAIVQKIGSQKVILLGQSWGALLATLFVTDNPEKVEKTILTGPGPILPVNRALADIVPPDSLHLKKPQFTNREANERVSNTRMRAVAYWAKTFGLKLAPDEEADDFQTLLTNELNKSTVTDTVHAAPAMGGGGYYAAIMTVNSFENIPDQREKLKAVTCPVLVMKGQYDNQPWGYTNEYLGVFPHARLVVVAGAGHSISLEQPDMYLKTIRAFLAE